VTDELDVGREHTPQSPHSSQAFWLWKREPHEQDSVWYGEQVIATLHAEALPGQVPAFPQTPVHDVPLATKASAGQARLDPSHVSATSHGPELGLQTVPAVAGAGIGHPAVAPSHAADKAHPDAGLHTVPCTLIASAGQTVVVPVQASGASQGPEGSRQVVPAVAYASAGQTVLDPVQYSA
jgi:hypothetical protein